MKQEQDKEIDLLLRRHARNEKSRLKGAFFVEEGNGEKAFGFEDSAHLDADEMNAYAENALPANARARYAKHLVDCNNCRTLVTRLALSANPIIDETKSETVANATERQSWGKWFLSLLTLPTLRIAGPVAAVLCIAVVSVVVWQSRNESPYLSKATQNMQGSNTSQDVSDNSNSVAMAPKSKVPSTGPGEVAPSSPVGTPSPESRNATTNVQRQPIQEKKEIDSKENNAPSAGPGGRSREQTADTTTLSAKSGAAKDDNVNDAPKPVTSQTETKTKVAEQRAEETQVTQQEAGQVIANKGRDMGERNIQRKVQRPAANDAGGTVASNPAPSKRAEDKKPEDERRNEAKQDSEKNEVFAKKAPKVELEMRTVSGRRFRREGAVWVDVAYNSSNATTNISRGSENYRSLIADEPGLRAIAEKLSGEVIVVWKGHAYRFR